MGSSYRAETEYKGYRIVVLGMEDPADGYVAQVLDPDTGDVVRSPVRGSPLFAVEAARECIDVILADARLKCEPDEVRAARETRLSAQWRATYRESAKAEERYGYLKCPAKPPHYCKTPGRWCRWRLGVKLGDMWRCETCGDVFKWTAGRYGGYFWTAASIEEWNTACEVAAARESEES